MRTDATSPPHTVRARGASWLPSRLSITAVTSGSYRPRRCSSSRPYDAPSRGPGTAGTRCAGRRPQVQMLPRRVAQDRLGERVVHEGIELSPGEPFGLGLPDLGRPGRHPGRPPGTGCRNSGQKLAVISSATSRRQPSMPNRSQCSATSSRYCPGLRGSSVLSLGSAGSPHHPRSQGRGGTLSPADAGRSSAGSRRLLVGASGTGASGRPAGEPSASRWNQSR